MLIRSRSATLPLLLTLGGGVFLLPATARSAPTWEHVDPPAGQTSPARVGPALVALPDGSTLIIGGLVDLAAKVPTAIVERLDPGASAKNRLVLATPLLQARHGHTATLLPDGRVLVAGGLDQNDQPLDTVEIGTLTPGVSPDPPSLAWTPGDPLGEARAFHTATALPNGKVLLLGGRGSTKDLASGEAFDPFAKGGAGKWNGVAPLPDSRRLHTATLLPDGRVLVAGGAQGNSALPSTWLLDPKAPSGNPWKPDQLVPAPESLLLGEVRAGHHAVLMPSGQVLLVGGCIKDPDSATCERPKADEFFTPDADTGTWAAFSALPRTQSPPDAVPLGQSVIGLRNGWALAVFGRTLTPDVTEQKEAFFLRPTAVSETLPLGLVQTPLGQPGAWGWFSLAINQPKVPFHSFAAVTLDATGSVVLAGGLAKTSLVATVDLLRYQPDGAVCTSADPLDCSGGVCLDGLCLTARANGLLCDQEPQCASRHCEQGPGNTAPFCCALQCTDECSPDSFSVVIGTCGATCGKEFLSCNGYRCEKAICQKSCAGSGDCATGYYCDPSDGGLCLPKRSKGATCSGEAECETGFCVDGVCCSSECNGICQACRADLTGLAESGTCGDLLAGRVDSQDRCASDGSECGNTGTCDGQGQCTQIPAGTLCGAGVTCSEVTQSRTETCDGDGTCESAVVNCGTNLRCDATNGLCPGDCDPTETRPEDGFNPACLDGFFCGSASRQCDKGLLCLSDTSFIDTTGVSAVRRDCQTHHRCLPSRPAACADAPCTSSLDCLADSVCRSDGRCTAPVTPSDDDPDCYCTLPGPRTPATPGLLAGLAALVALGRRRARVQPPAGTTRSR